MMTGYKDRTFCMARACKHFGNGCERSLTDQVVERAKKWWGGDNPPISIFVNAPECYEERKDDE